MQNLVNLVLKGVEDERKPLEEFASFGKNVIESERLTDRIYSSFLGLITKGWESWNAESRKEYGFAISDVGMLYTIGPYIPCVERVTLTESIDLASDGMPGIRTVGGLMLDDKGEDYYVLRPIHKFPQHIMLLDRNAKRYKLIMFEEGKTMNATVIYFGIKKNGDIASAFNKKSDVPYAYHGASKAYAALVANAWADGKYLWLTETSENIGVGGVRDLRLRLGVDKESIKSLFYARSLPLTDTGRKRPILHWVRSHKRRIKEGVDVDVTKHLRGITELEMHGLSLRITQPDKDALKGADPEYVNEAFKLYAPQHKQED